MSNTRKLVDSKISNDFGLSIDTVAEKCKSYGRFNSWLNQDITKIKRVLNNVKDIGISPAFFASYEKSEGYNSKWGWLNHTSQKGDYYQDATSVAGVVLNQSKNMSGRPSWIDYGNPVDFVPKSVKDEGNNHFTSLPSGTIGRALIPLTAAATWSTYYPKGLLKEYNKVQNYADPIKVIADSIIAWGGNFDGEASPDPDPSDPPVDGNWEGLNLEELFSEVRDLIKNMLSNDVFKSVNSDYYSNSYLQLINQMENSYKVNANKPFYDKIENTFKDFNDNYKPDPDPDPDPEPEPEPEPSGQWYFPVKMGNGINFWKRSNWGVGTLQRNMTYGVRSGGKFHAGYDIGGGGNRHSIYAVADAVVTDVRWVNGGGHSIFLNHKNDEYHTLYMHLQNNSATVEKGDSVSAGQKIATMGATGGNYAIHLHIEFSKTGKHHTKENTLDPEPLLKITADNKTGLPIP